MCKLHIDVKMLSIAHLMQIVQEKNIKIRDKYYSCPFRQASKK